MTDTISIAAQPRERTGKTSRPLSREGRIPAVLYGAGREPVTISIDQHEFEMFMQAHATGANIVKVDLADSGESVNAVIKEVQHSPVKGAILHVDFLAIRMDEKLQAAVTVNLVGDAEGVKEGGILMQNMREVLVEALPTDLPEAIDFDISDMIIGSTLHVSDLVAPADVEIIDDEQGIICSITVPTEEPTEEEIAELLGEELEEGEVEVIGEEGEELEEGEEGAAEEPAEES
jgi:large subunit ribosomal protein L25